MKRRAQPAQRPWVGCHPGALAATSAVTSGSRRSAASIRSRAGASRRQSAHGTGRARRRSGRGSGSPSAGGTMEWES